MFLTDTPLEFASNYIHLLGWPALCIVFYWIGRTLQNGIAEYKEDRGKMAPQDFIAWIIEVHAHQENK